MAAADPSLASPAAPEAASARALETASLFGRHLLAFWFPGTAFLFLVTGPHSWYVALLFLAPGFVAYWLDTSGRRELRQPPEGLPDWPFDGIVYSLAALQLVNVASCALAIRICSPSTSWWATSWWRELGLLDHRPRADPPVERQQRLGARAAGITSTSRHLRGHHLRAATADDPATARFGRLQRFYRRTVPAQLASAWRLEKR
jgi:hypothetical protein